jgi:hypothetical protein
MRRGQAQLCEEQAMHHARMSAIDAMPQRISGKHDARNHRTLDEAETTSIRAQVTPGRRALSPFANADILGLSMSKPHALPKTLGSDSTLLKPGDRAVRGNLS